MKVFKRALSVCLALAMVFSAFVMPTATKAAAVEYKPNRVAGQTSSVTGNKLHPFTSTEELIRDAIEELRSKNMVASLKEQDAALVAAVEEASDMSYEDAKSSIAAALKDGMSIGQIDVSAFGLSKENMSKLMHEVLSDYYLYNAVSELTYTTVGNKVTKVGFAVSEGFTAAMDAVNDGAFDIHLHVNGNMASGAIDVEQLHDLQQNADTNVGLGIIGKKPTGDFSTNNQIMAADEEEGEGSTTAPSCYLHTVKTTGRMPVDFDNNGELQVRDVLSLLQMVSDYDSEDPESVPGPDVNEDGAFNVRDVRALAEYAANEEWPETDGLVGLTYDWAEYQDYSPVFYMDAEGYYLDAEGNRRFIMDPETGVLYNEAGEAVYQPIDAEGNYADMQGNPAQPFNDSIANGGLLYNPETGEISTGLLPNIYYKLTGITFHCTVCDQDVTVADDPETAEDELAQFSMTQDIWVNMVTGEAIPTEVGAQPELAEGDSIDNYILYTDMTIGMYRDDTSFLFDAEGNMIMGEDGNPAVNYVMDEQGNPVLDEDGNVQLIGIFTSEPQDNGTAEFMYYYAVLSAFNADHANYFGVSADYWTSKNTESTPIGAVLSLCNMDPATPIVPAQMLMLVQMLPQAFMAYVYYYGAELLAMTDAAMAAVDALPKDATTIQKLLVIHDWLAENAVFDMGSMLNVSDTGEAQMDPMQMTTFGALLSNQLTTIQNSGYYGGICLAYAAAYAYLVQAAFPEIYQVEEFVDTDGDGESDTKVTRWATPKEVDMNGGDIVDFSQVMFYTDTRESSVAGEGFGGGAFNNVHYFNAVYLDDAHEDPTHREQNMSMGGMGGSTTGDQDQIGKWFYVDACYDDIYLECLSQYRVEAEGSVYHTYFLVSPQTMGKLWSSSIDYIDSPYDGYTYVVETDASGNPVVSDNIDETLDDGTPNPNYDPNHPNYVKVVAEGETKNHNTSYETSWFSGAVSKIYFDGDNWYYVDSGESASAQTAMIDENGDVNIDFGDSGMDIDSLSHSTRVDKTGQDKMVVRPMDAPDWWEDESEDSSDMSSMMSAKADPYADYVFDYGTGETGDGAAVADALAAAVVEDFIYRDQFPALTHSIGLVEDTIFFNLGNQVWSMNVGDATVTNTDEEGNTTTETVKVGKNVALFKEYNTVTASSDGRTFLGSSYTMDPDGTALTVHDNPIAALCVRDAYTPLYDYYDAEGKLVMSFDGTISDAYMQKLQSGAMTQEQLMAAIAGRVFVAMAAVPTMTVNIGTNWSYTAAFADDLDEDQKLASIYTAEAINYNPDYTLGLSDDDANSNKEFLWCANIREDVSLDKWEASTGTDSVPCTAKNDGHTYVYNEEEGVFLCSECKLHAFNIVGETEHAEVILTATTSTGISDDFMADNGVNPDETDTTVHSVSPEREGAITQDTIDVKVIVEEGYGLPVLTYTLVGAEVEEEETPAEGEEETPADPTAFTVELTESEEEPGVYTGTITKGAEGCLIVEVSAVEAAKLTVEDAENGTVTVTAEPAAEEETPVETAAEESITVNEGETAYVAIGDQVTITAEADEGYVIKSVKYSYLSTVTEEETPEEGGEEVTPAAEGDGETGDGETGDGETGDGDTTEDQDPTYVDVVLEANEDGTYTFEMPAEDVTVTVEFVKQYAIEVDTIANDADGEPLGEVEVVEVATEGEEITVVVTPAENYAVDEIFVTYKVTTVEGETTTTKTEIINPTAGENGAYTFKMPAADVNIHVTFALDVELFAITVDEVNEAEGAVDVDMEEAAEDTVVTVTVTPEDGYDVDKVTIVYDVVTGEGEEATTTATTVELEKDEEGNYTFEMPAADVTVKVTFKKVYDVALGFEATSGTVTADKETAAEGETVTVTVEALEGFELAENGVKVTTVPETGDGVEVAVTSGETAGTYTFTMPAAAVKVVVTFEEVEEEENATYTVTVADGITNGTVTAAPLTELEEGDEVTVTVTPADGYELATLTYTVADGEPVTITATEDVYSFEMPAGNVIINATFTAKTYNITTQMDANVGNSSFEVPATAKTGDVVTVKVKPAEGYEVVSVQYKIGEADPVDAVKGEGNDYTFTMPAADVTVIVSIRAIANSGDSTGDDEL